MSYIKDIFDKIKTLNNQNNLPSNLKTEINKNVKTLLPNLNSSQVEILTQLAVFLTEAIRRKFLNSIQNEKDIIRQLTMNNARDCKSIILMLLPFIDDKDNNNTILKLPSSSPLPPPLQVYIE